MKTTIVTTAYLFLSMCIFGQVKSFQDIPKELLEQLNEMGKDYSPVLNKQESEYFNTIYRDSLKGFDFNEKKIGFITRGRANNKREYFDVERRLFQFNQSPTVAGLYLFNEEQKKESGGYDAVIDKWGKMYISKEEIIQRLKKSRKK